ncbi:hypothetical protein [Hymenobacter defluvii]|uniref:Glycosyltransferase RgtA/B/C/D-like domain-containing protein n=1 Tax=Hymenobacter defluvii TaxID=2054411 RepID=A0ABS3TCM5_9BACT|nr:hypothetical protein [Hymenobacter defluvii]MBO3271384.1 hypothetical protein [Hymenobacter defluvii]
MMFRRALSHSISARSQVPTWFWVGLVAWHILFFGVQLHQRTYFFPDTDRYRMEAVNIREAGEFYAQPLPATGAKKPQEYTIRPPGYPLFLLALDTPSARFPFVALVVQNLLSLLNLGLLARWLQQFRLLPAQWVFLLLGVCTYPAQLIYANVLMSEMLLQTCVVLLWLSAVAAWETQQMRYALAVAATATAAMLVKPVFYPFSIVVLLVGSWAALRWRRLPVAVVAALPLAVALLYQGWNYQRTGLFHFSSIATINLLHYNTEGVLRRTEGAVVADHFIDTVEAEAHRRYATFAQQQQHIRARSMAVLWEYPVTYARIHLTGMVNCFLDPGRFDLVHFFKLPGQEGRGLLGQYTVYGYKGMARYIWRLPLGLLSALLLVAVGNVVRLLAFGLFLFQRQYALFVRLSAAGILLYVAFLTGPLGAARFAVPVFPLLVVGATLGSRKLFLMLPSVALPRA